MLAGHLLPGVEHPGHVDNRSDQAAGQINHHGEASLHVSAAQPPAGITVDTGPGSGIPRDRVGVPADDQSLGPVELGTGYQVVPDPVDSQAGNAPQVSFDPSRQGGLIEADRRNVDQFRR